MSRHIAVFSFPAYAHVAPVLPVVAELVRRGHRVTFAVVDEFAAEVAATGAEVLPYTSTFPWATGLGDSGSDGYALRAMLAFMAEGLAPLPSAVRRFAGDPPDLVVHDLAASETARLLARKWSVPTVQSCPEFASNEHFAMNAAQAAEDAGPPPDLDDPGLAAFVEEAERLLAEHGLSDVDTSGDAGYHLVYLPKAFQIRGETFDDRFAFVGPCFDRSGPAGEWAPPADGLPVVLISLGTSRSREQTGFFRKCVRAFTGQPWHVVLTLGRWVDPAELGPLPPNVEAHPFVAHAALLPHTKVFVTHGGLGSTMESLHYGVPMVVTPSQSDQVVTAARIAELDLGRVVSRTGVTERELLDAVTETAADPVVGRRVRWMSEQVRQAGGETRAADAVESWLEGAVR
ncbi:macrolide family glycosyltransferase [Amycolatopsis australiensis]|uniref:macrolide family glycosyltransferase n=1 Tax=Amycolatopsis australiensis TaxID=546364 RepID=UPI0015A570DD|nr:macrolide family glycosyltransferase [Amycolatopsis australiensis]